MAEQKERVLFWVDDDGPDRFMHEEDRLEAEGWRVVWATSVKEALVELAQQGFDAILLDQMLPLVSDPVASRDVWSGCLLLYWLKGKSRPAKAPQVEGGDIFSEAAPHPANQSVRVVIVSAFHDDEIEAAIEAIEGSIPTIRKPIEFDSLLMKLR